MHPECATQPRIKADLTKAMGTTDADKRRAVMGELQEMLQSSSAISQPFWMGQHLENVCLDS